MDWLNWLWWTLTVFLMGLGFLGILVPFLPGTAMILAGAVLHFALFPKDQTIGWWTIGVLVLLTILSHVVDFVAGALGAKKFGASKWGVAGGIGGGLVGLFFGLPGLILGPLIGVMTVELISSQRIDQAAKSTWGTVIGGLAGVLFKLIIGAAMIACFFLSLPKG